MRGERLSGAMTLQSMTRRDLGPFSIGRMAYICLHHWKQLENATRKSIFKSTLDLKPLKLL